MKTRIAIALGVLLVVLSSVAGWWAWDTGRIPGNPRASSLEAMQPAILRHLATTSRHQQHGGCLTLDLGAPRAELQGQEGIAQRALPGQFAVTLLLEPRAHERDARERQLAQLDYLARQGFFTAVQTSVLTDAGTRPGRRYVMTWKGYAELGAPQYGAPCFSVGDSAFESIESAEPLAQAVAGIEAWSVSIVSQVRNVPDWAQGEEAKRIFPRLGNRTQPLREKVTLLRGRDGWISEGEARLQLMDTRQGGAEAMARYYEALRERSNAQALDFGAARAALEAHLASEPWLRRHASGCLPLRLMRGGDDREPQPREGAFTTTFYDLPAAKRPAYSRTMMVTALHGLNALEAAGLATFKPVGRGTVKFGRESVAAARGVRYTVSPEALDALGVGRGNPCIPAGKLSVEILALRSGGPGVAQIIARGKVSQSPEWAGRLAEHLPALKVVLEEGVPVAGQIRYAQGSWRINTLMPLYPEVQSVSVPAPLRRHLPMTEASHPVVMAPAVLK